MKLIVSTHNLRLTERLKTISSADRKTSHLDALPWMRELPSSGTMQNRLNGSFPARCGCPFRPDLFAEDVESDLYAAIDLVAKKSNNRSGASEQVQSPEAQGGCSY